MALPIKPPTGPPKPSVVNPAVNPQAAGPVRPDNTSVAPGKTMTPGQVEAHKYNENQEGLYLGNDKASIIRQQKYLASLGYKVTPDGQRGPLTNSAWQSYKTGFGPQRWNSFIAKHVGASPTAPSAADTHPGADVPPGPTTATPPRGTTDVKKTNPVDTQTTALMKLLGLGGKYGSIDPRAYATAAARAEFDPGIADLTHQQDVNTRQGAQDQTDIQNWYAKLLAQAGGAATDNTNALKDALSGMDAANKGAVEALGGGAAANDAAAWGAISRGKLAGEGLAQGAFDNNIQPAFALQGVDAALRNKNTTASAQQDLAVKLAAQHQAKGQAYVKDLADATTQKQQMDIAHTNQVAQLAMLPYQLQDAKLGLKGKQVGLKAANLSYDMDKVKLALAKRGLGANGSIPKWGTLNPQNLQQLQQSLVAPVVNKKNPNMLAVDPARVFNSWGNQLRTFSNGAWDPHANPQLNQWRNQILSSFLPAWNAAHPKRQYGLKNGQLFLNGKQVSNV